MLGPGVLQSPTLSGVPSVGGIPDTAYESRGGRNQDESSLFARIGGFSRTLSAPLNPPSSTTEGDTLLNKLLNGVQRVAEGCPDPRPCPADRRVARGPHRPTRPPTLSTMPLVTPFDVERHGVHVATYVDPHVD